MKIEEWTQNFKKGDLISFLELHSLYIKFIKLLFYLSEIEKNGKFPPKTNYWDETFSIDKSILQEVDKLIKIKRLPKLVNKWRDYKYIPIKVRNRIAHHLITIKNGKIETWDNRNKKIQYKEFSEQKTELIMFLTLSYNIIGISIPDDLIRKIFSAIL